MKTDLIHSLTDSFEAHAQQTDGGVVVKGVSIAIVSRNEMSSMLSLMKAAARVDETQHNA